RGIATKNTKSHKREEQKRTREAAREAENAPMKWSTLAARWPILPSFLSPFCAFLCFLWLFLLSSAVSAATPSLGSVSPRGGQRGKEVVFSFNGGRLSDAQEVLFYSPGFRVSKLEVVNDGQVKATVKIAEDCLPGEHPVRLRTKSGISELRTIWVGALPAIAEKEPNSEFDKPQKIPLNVTVEGVVDTEDVDYYAVELKKGQRLSVEIEAMRLGVTFFDPYIAILDSKRFELATSDDSPLNKQD